ncbi:MAG: hypothetical protein ACN4GK_03630 [Acidimicrobiia bacterium]
MIRRLTLCSLAALVAVSCTTAGDTSTTVGPTASTTAPPTTTTSTAAAPSTTTTISPVVGEIRATLDAYSTALAEADAETAVRFVDRGTLELFDDLLLLASSNVHADDLDFLDAFLVMRFRHRFTSDQLDSLTAPDVFLTALEDGLMFSPVGELSFDAFNIIDDEATGEIAGSPAMWFSLEDGVWKIALGRTFDEYSSVLSLSLEAAALNAAGEGATRNDALLALLTELEGVVVDSDILTGPR